MSCSVVKMILRYKKTCRNKLTLSSGAKNTKILKQNVWQLAAVYRIEIFSLPANILLVWTWFFNFGRVNFWNASNEGWKTLKIFGNLSVCTDLTGNYISSRQFLLIIDKLRYWHAKITSEQSSHWSFLFKFSCQSLNS